MLEKVVGYDPRVLYSLNVEAQNNVVPSYIDMSHAPHRVLQQPQLHTGTS